MFYNCDKELLHYAWYRTGEGPALLLQLRFPAGLVLRKYLLGEILPEYPHIGQRALDAFQHPPVKYLFPDKVDIAGAGTSFLALRYWA
ncbi:hypothetical protein [Diplocloster modestus]|uniref:Uncharacterized protein n=1 Tax=Diplocloster modestus TaxID=2850322 RepID=A0ABS6K6U4_9FIRM|nr:hypothetical protein [Diplocloster modestus]MBU9726229.1 hypothetical protein [Diplocloster modestus]